MSWKSFWTKARPWVSVGLSKLWEYVQKKLAERALRQIEEKLEAEIAAKKSAVADASK